MREDIKKLLELQKLDNIYDDINRRLIELPELIEEENNKALRYEEEVNTAKKELTELNLKLKDKEIKLLQTEEIIKKHTEQLNSLKSNEAYSKMQEELKQEKTQIDEIENEILNLYDEIDSQQLKIKDLEVQLKDRKNNIKEKQDEYRQRIEDLKKNKDEVEQLIVPVKEKITDNLLNLYEKIRKLRGGTTLVEVNNSSCGGCHLQLPPQIVNEIIKEEEIVRCENCSRFLYIADE